MTELCSDRNVRKKSFRICKLKQSVGCEQVSLEETTCLEIIHEKRPDNSSNSISKTLSTPKVSTELGSMRNREADIVTRIPWESEAEVICSVLCP